MSKSTLKLTILAIDLAFALNGQSILETIETAAEVAVQVFVPGVDLVNCAMDGCSTIDWVLAVGEVAMVVVPVGAVAAIAYKGYKVVQKSRKLKKLADVTKGALNPQQAKNLARFDKKKPANSTDTVIRDLPGGGKAFQADYSRIIRSV